MERVQGILVKIEEKARDRASWYPSGRKWLTDDDSQLLNECIRTFAQRHMTYLLQSLIFEKMVEGSFSETLALMEWHIRRNLEIFRSDQLTMNQKDPNMMIYDSVRITGLKISSHINMTLIKLCSNPSDMPLKSALIRLVICLCQNTMLLK